MTMNFSAQRAFVGSMLMAMVVMCLFPSSALAQKKYNPTHPKVRKLCDGAVDWLISGRRSIETDTIGALAVVEYYKRYEGTIPTDVPYVSSTVEELAGMVSAGSAEIFSARETYFPALALILLAEYDVKKYEAECLKILEALIDRQLDNGGYTYSNSQTGDTSQSQFGALAMFVARQHRLTFDPEVARNLLSFYVNYQAQNGTWAYQPATPNAGGAQGTASLHSASLSSVYLLADVLRLSRRVKKMSVASGDLDLDLPKNVTIYVPPKVGELAKIEEAWGGGDGPVVKFERGRLSTCKSRGNQWYSSSFSFPSRKWNAYMMYALERYAYFKEQAEGSLPGSLSRWYDDGVDYISEYRKDDGSLDSKSRVPTMPADANTALYVLFLVRASEIISLPPVGTTMDGAVGFGKGEIRQGKDGKLRSSSAEKSLQGLIDALSDGNLDDRQLQQITEAMKRSIREFKQKGDRSRGEVTAFLKTMISEKNFHRRLIAIKFLAAEQDMDNVPALLYAMGDPDPVIAEQAHNGLRLISRKVDTFVFQSKGNKDDNLLEFVRLKQQWTKWFLAIRPDAELLE